MSELSEFFERFEHPDHGLRVHIDREFVKVHRKLDHILERIAHMSASLAQQLTDALASITADVDAVSTEVTALLALLQGQVGQTVTQAMVDAATSIDQRLKAIPPAPTP